MTRYADPQRCPDCGNPIAYGAAMCPACDLPLSGDVARELFVTLSRADQLLATLRSVPATVPAVPPAVAPAAGPTAPAPAGGMAFPGTPPAPRHHGLSAASVPKILLTLGAGCLLVAALVFLAVTWSVMGVAGRTATLVGFTLVTGGLTAWMARRGLRAATESLGLVALGLLTMDTFGARHSGWLGDVSDAGFRLVLGLVLVAAATAAALAVRRTPARGFTGGEVVTSAGTALVASGVAGWSWLEQSPGLVLAVLVAAAAAAGAWALRLKVATAGAGVVTLAAWLPLTSTALQRAATHDTVRELWGHLEVWPLLVSAALVAAVALLPLPLPARVAATAVGTALLAVAVTLPAFDEGPTALTLTGIAVLVVTGGLTWLAPRPWGLAGLLAQAIAGLGVLVAAGALGTAALERIGHTVEVAWTGSAGARYPAFVEPDLPQQWLLLLGVAALAGTVLVLAAADPVLDTLARPLVDVRLGVAVALASGVLTLTLYPVPVAVVVAVLAAATLALTVAWWRSHDTLWLVVALGALLAGLVVSLVAEWLTFVVLGTGLVAAALAHLRARLASVAVGAGMATALVLAGTAWTVGALVDAGWSWTALGALLALGAVTLAAPTAPARWWVTPPTVARDGLEAGAATAAVPLGAAGALLAPAGEAATWTAVYLTVAGAVVVAMSLLRADRRLLGWPGGALLALASWVRLWDIGVHQPEAYTLPTAAALLVVGLVHLRRHPRTHTVSALGPALSLALVPSLLWALVDPVSLRSLLLGLACLGLVVAGARLRWTAPVTFGATVGAVLVIRLAAPYIGGTVPRWVLIGAAGAALIAMGVTWERRLQDARHAMAYLHRLR